MFANVNKYITWPDRSHHSVLTKFANIRNKPFPDTFATVDGCHIPIKSPMTNSTSYYNRKRFHSIILQWICDTKYRLLYTYIGWPESTHDARVWRNSSIFARLQNSAHLLLLTKGHILGDLAYPCDILLVSLSPYQDDGHLSVKQKTFNVVLSRTRFVTEQAFGLLKGKLQRLLRLYPTTRSMVCLNTAN